ncbi:hypothetical protein KA107_01860 [Candidatus Pacearchaeota archaeon]|nr:hypothetical protein [Candidatus Pacearchaeota archaeon]
MADFDLLRGFFPEIGEATLKKLVDDPDFLKDLPGLIKSRLDSAQSVVPINTEYLLMLFSGAKFAEEEEKIYVSSRLQNYFRFNGNFLPLMVDYLAAADSAQKRNEREIIDVSVDFASRCLFSLAFFHPALERLYKKRGAPHPEFYRDRGKKTFRYIGLPELSDHFDNWENFLGREFVRR